MPTSGRGAAAAGAPPQRGAATSLVAAARTAQRRGLTRTVGAPPTVRGTGGPRAAPEPGSPRPSEAAVSGRARVAGAVAGRSPSPRGRSQSPGRGASPRRGGSPVWRLVRASEGELAEEEVPFRSDYTRATCGLAEVVWDYIVCGGQVPWVRCSPADSAALEEAYQSDAGEVRLPPSREWGCGERTCNLQNMRVSAGAAEAAWRLRRRELTEGLRPYPVASAAEYSERYLRRVKHGSDVHLDGFHGGTREVQTISGSDAVAAAVTSTGQVWTGERDGTLRVWSARTGARLFTTEQKRDVWCTALLDAPAEEAVWVGFTDSVIRVFANAHPYDIRISLKRHAPRTAIRALCWLRAGAESLVASAGQDAQILLWDPSSYLCVRSLSEHSNGVRCLLYDNAVLYSGSDDGTLRLWKLGAAGCGGCTSVWRGHSGGVQHAAAHGGEIWTGSEDKTVRVWDAETGECLKVYPCDAPVNSLACLGDKVWSSSNATLFLWDARVLRDEPLGRYSASHSKYVSNILSVHTSVIIRAWTAAQDGTIKVWDTECGGDCTTLSAERAAELGEVRGRLADAEERLGAMQRQESERERSLRSELESARSQLCAAMAELGPLKQQLAQALSSSARAERERDEARKRAQALESGDAAAERERELEGLRSEHAAAVSELEHKLAEARAELGTQTRELAAVAEALCAPAVSDALGQPGGGDHALVASRARDLADAVLGGGGPAGRLQSDATLEVSETLRSELRGAEDDLAAMRQRLVAAEKRARDSHLEHQDAAYALEQAKTALAAERRRAEELEKRAEELEDMLAEAETARQDLLEAGDGPGVELGSGGESPSGSPPRAGAAPRHGAAAGNRHSRDDEYDDGNQFASTYSHGRRMQQRPDTGDRLAASYRDQALSGAHRSQLPTAAGRSAADRRSASPQERSPAGSALQVEQQPSALRTPAADPLGATDGSVTARGLPSATSGGGAHPGGRQRGASTASRGTAAAAPPDDGGRRVPSPRRAADGGEHLDASSRSVGRGPHGEALNDTRRSLGRSQLEESQSGALRTPAEVPLEGADGDGAAVRGLPGAAGAAGDTPRGRRRGASTASRSTAAAPSAPGGGRRTTSPRRAADSQRLDGSRRSPGRSQPSVSSPRSPGRGDPLDSSRRSAGRSEDLDRSTRSLGGRGGPAAARRVASSQSVRSTGTGAGSRMGASQKLSPRESRVSASQQGSRLGASQGRAQQPQSSERLPQPPPSPDSELGPDIELIRSPSHDSQDTLPDQGHPADSTRSPADAREARSGSMRRAGTQQGHPRDTTRTASGTVLASPRKGASGGGAPDLLAVSWRSDATSAQPVEGSAAATYGGSVGLDLRRAASSSSRQAAEAAHPAASRRSDGGRGDLPRGLEGSERRPAPEGSLQGSRRQPDAPDGPQGSRRGDADPLLESARVGAGSERADLGASQRTRAAVDRSRLGPDEVPAQGPLSPRSLFRAPVRTVTLQTADGRSADLSLREGDSEATNATLARAELGFPESRRMRITGEDGRIVHLTFADVSDGERLLCADGGFDGKTVRVHPASGGPPAALQLPRFTPQGAATTVGGETNCPTGLARWLGGHAAALRLGPDEELVALPSAAAEPATEQHALVYNDLRDGSDIFLATRRRDPKSVQVRDVRSGKSVRFAVRAGMDEPSAADALRAALIRAGIACSADEHVGLELPGRQGAVPLRHSELRHGVEYQLASRLVDPKTITVRVHNPEDGDSTAVAVRVRAGHSVAETELALLSAVRGAGLNVPQDSAVTLRGGDAQPMVLSHATLPDGAAFEAMPRGGDGCWELRLERRAPRAVALVGPHGEQASCAVRPGATEHENLRAARSALAAAGMALGADELLQLRREADGAPVLFAHAAVSDGETLLAGVAAAEPRTVYVQGAGGELCAVQLQAGDSPAAAQRKLREALGRFDLSEDEVIQLEPLGGGPPVSPTHSSVTAGRQYRGKVSRVAPKHIELSAAADGKLPPRRVTLTLHAAASEGDNLRAAQAAGIGGQTEKGRRLVLRDALGLPVELSHAAVSDGGKYQAVAEGTAGEQQGSARSRASSLLQMGAPSRVGAPGAAGKAPAAGERMHIARLPCGRCVAVRGDGPGPRLIAGAEERLVTPGGGAVSGPDGLPVFLAADGSVLERSTGRPLALVSTHEGTPVAMRVGEDGVTLQDADGNGITGPDGAPVVLGDGGTLASGRGMPLSLVAGAGDAETAVIVATPQGSGGRAHQPADVAQGGGGPGGEQTAAGHAPQQRVVLRRAPLEAPTSAAARRPPPGHGAAAGTQPGVAPLTAAGSDQLPQSGGADQSRAEAARAAQGQEPGSAVLYDPAAAPGEQPPQLDPASELLVWHRNREVKYAKLGALARAMREHNASLLGENALLAESCTALEEIAEQRPFLISIIFDLYKMSASCRKGLDKFAKDVRDRDRGKLELLQRIGDTAERVTDIMNGEKWLLANLFSEDELLHIGASTHFFVPDGKRFSRFRASAGLHNAAPLGTGRWARVTAVSSPPRTRSHSPVGEWPSGRPRTPTGCARASESGAESWAGSQRRAAAQNRRWGD